MRRQYWKSRDILYPVPIVTVSCQGERKKPNIITAAWCGTILSTPAILYVSIRPERYSHGVINEMKGSVMNPVNQNLAFTTDYCGVKFGRDVDKYEEMSLTPLPLEQIATPGIEESPMNLKYRVVDTKSSGSHDVFLAEVVDVTVDDHYMDETDKLNLNQTGFVAYSHREYFEPGEKPGKFGYSVKEPNKKRR